MDEETDVMTATRSSLAARVSQNHRHAYGGSKQPHEIEEEIARTRVRLSAAIQALERELAPAQVIENSREMLRSFLEPGPGPFREQVWAYAIPLALIATGLGWLFLLRRRRWQADLPSSFGELPGEAVETGQMPASAPLYANMVEPIETVSLVDEKTAI